jgi:Zn/Cd-binding protein ZinT
MQLFISLELKIMIRFGDHLITPFGTIDQKVFDRIKRKVIKEQIKKWITIDPAKHNGFEILSEIGS